MARPTVWVSTTTRDVALGANGPGEQWTHVGTINPQHEKELWRLVQVHLGIKPNAPLPTAFYLDGLSTSSWVAQAKDRSNPCEPFWLAIDPLGDASRYLVTVEQSTVGVLSRRPAEPSPGLLSKPIPVCIRLSSKDSRVFDQIGPVEP